MHQVRFGRKREVFSVNEIHAEPPFPCGSVTPGNGYCKRIMISTTESKRFFCFVCLFVCLKHKWLVLCVVLCPVVRRSRPAVVACCTVPLGVFHHWIHHLWLLGAAPHLGFNPLRRGWVYRPAPEAPRKGDCRRGPRHFWNCLSCWDSALRQDPL